MLLQLIELILTTIGWRHARKTRDKTNPSITEWWKARKQGYRH